MKFNAAILVESKQPLVVDEINLVNPLRAGQVLVEILFSGICGAQINEIDAVKGVDKFLPHLLGHEGIGVVRETGELVKHVKEGDRVVLHWMPGEGFQSLPAEYLWQGRKLNSGWVTTFSEMAVVSGNRVTPIVSTLDLELLPLFGCAATTAFGVIANDAKVKFGDSIVIIGTGGVGLLTIEVARASGAHPIIGVEKFENRIQAALDFGSNIVFKTKEKHELKNEILTFLGGASPDVVIETSGNTEMIELSYELISKQGRAVLVGVPKHDDPAKIDTLPLHFETVLIGSKGGQTKPQFDIPKLVKLAELDLFRVNKIPINKVRLGNINDGIRNLRDGFPGRTIVEMKN